MNSLFKQIKAQVTARQAAERYGVPVSRTGMACCIFHNDRHPSMKIDERFFCFSCHATGDVFDFTAKLFGLSLWEAAKKLATDFGIRPLPPGQSASLPMISPVQSERKEEQRILGLLIDCEQVLKKWKEDYAPSAQDEENWDDRFVQAVQYLMPVSYAIECLLSADPDDRKDMMDYVRRTNMEAQAKAILEGKDCEVKNHGRDEEHAA